jgi:hypothetical protein
VWTSGDSGGRESAPAVRTNREVVAQAVRRSRAPRARRINGGTARSMGWCTAVLTSTIRTHRRAAPGVGLLGGEVSPDQVCGIDGPLTCDGGALPGLGMAPLQAGGAHQPPDPLAGDTDALDHQPARRGRRVHVRPRTSAMITPASRHASTSASRSSAHATTTSTLPARTVSSSARNCGRGFRPDLAARVQAAADTDPSARAVLAALAAVRAELGAMALEPPPPQFVQRWADAIGPAGGVRLQGPGPRQRRRRRARPPWNAATPSTPRNSPPPPPGSSLGPGGVCPP